MRIILSSFLIGILMFSTPGMAQETANEKVIVAVESAKVQLSRIDNGDYNLENGYADIFTNLVSQEQWLQQIAAVRTPLGDLLKREVSASEYQTTMAGAPDGEYVMLQFQTEFQNKKEAVETVVMMFEASQWRLAGYFIK